MKHYPYQDVRLTSGYLFGKQELNRTITIDTVYDRFLETGRIAAFDFGYDPGAEGAVKPHFFWDSDVAKWIEGVAYILKYHPEMQELEEKRTASYPKSRSIRRRMDISISTLPLLSPKTDSPIATRMSFTVRDI
jgi:hypothetical protein